MLASAGPMPPDAHFEVTIGDVAEEVIATAKSLGVDLIALGLKGARYLRGPTAMDARLQSRM